jgi:cytochrome c553
MDEPVAWAVYGRVTGNLMRVVMHDDLDDEDMTDLREWYDVKPLYLREKKDNDNG